MIKAAQSDIRFERPFFSLWVSSILLLTIGCASAPESKAPRAYTPSEETLNAIWAATHTDELFDSLPIKMPIQEMIHDRFHGMGADYQNEILKLLDRNLEPQRLQRMLKSHLLKNFNASKAEKVLKFYQTPSGALYGAAGHNFNPEDPAFQAFVEGPKPSPERLEQLALLLTASGSAKFASITLITPLETIFFELEHQKRLAGQKPHHEPASELRESMQQVVKSMHKAMLLTASFVYRDLTDAQMRELIDFESSKSSKWYNVTLLQAYETTLQIAMRRFTRQLLAFIQKGTEPEAD